MELRFKNFQNGKKMTFDITKLLLVRKIEKSSVSAKMYRNNCFYYKN